MNIGKLCALAVVLSGCATLSAGRYQPYGTAFGDPEPKRQAIRSFLSTLTLSERVAQRCVLHLPRGLSLEEVREYIQERKPGGVILYKWNYDSLEELISLTGTIRDAYPPGYPPPFICADQEGGRVRAFPFKEFAQFPSAFQLGRYRDPELVRSAAYVTATQMREAGVNMNLAPVLDLVERGDSSIIGDRSYGKDPGWVSQAGRAYLRGMREGGVIPVVKHFPGHGATRVDSHGALPVVELSEEELFRRDLIPFRAAIQAGAPVVMTAHILYPRMDPDFPVTLSERVLNRLLRGRLGFQGVVMSDGLEMGALSGRFSLKDTVYYSLKAGVDLLLLYTRYRLEEVVAIVETLLEEGLLTGEEVDRGVEGVLALKAAYGLWSP